MEDKKYFDDVMERKQKAMLLSTGPHLFIDDYLIAESSNVRRVTHQPEKLPEPVLPSGIAPWHNQPQWFMRVAHDAPAGLFRAWYNVKNPGGHARSDGTGTGIPFVCYAYAESRDGIRWHYPDLGLVEMEGSRKNNLLDAVFANFSLFLVDDGTREPDPVRRFKMAYFEARRGDAGKNGMSVTFSPDGMRFTPFPGNPVIPGGPSNPVIGDIIDGCYDPLKQEYLLGCKIEQEGYPGKPHFHAEGWRRCVGMSTSKDFIHWSKPGIIVTPDPANGIEEFYGFKPMVRGNLYMGFLRILRDDLPATKDGPVEGIGWTELMTSRDGRNWVRHQDKFLDRSPAEGAWDHAMTWFGDCVQAGDKEYIYYGGYSHGHKVGDRAVGLGFLRQNGFVSRDAGSEIGSLRTPPVVITGSAVTINAKATGEIRVRITDGQGQPLLGFDWEDGLPIQGDSVRHPLKWKSADLSTLRGKPVRLEFRLRQAELYALDVI